MRIRQQVRQVQCGSELQLHNKNLQNMKIPIQTSHSMTRFMIPKIGIFTQYREDKGRIFNNLACDYVDAIENSGGLVIMIPVFTDDIGDYIELCSGFVFPGWVDIDPALYGQEIDGASGVIHTNDAFLIDAMRRVFASGKPILWISKWMQLLNIAHGGTLKQHIKTAEEHFQPERWYEEIHTVRIIESDSWLASIYTTPELSVNSIHHQAIDTTGNGIRIIARSDPDDEIESIEHESLPHYGVQWHPEYLDSASLFSFFIQQCQ